MAQARPDHDREDVDGAVIRHRLLLTLLPALGLLVLALWLFSVLVERSILRSAERHSVSWAEHAAAHIGGLKEIAAGAPPTEADQKAIADMKRFGGVFKFKVFDARGQLQFVSDNPDPERGTLSQHNAIAALVFETNAPHTEVAYNTDDESRPVFYSETYLPIYVDGRLTAVVELYLDQTKTMADISRDFMVFGIGIGLLVVLSLFSPIAIILAMSGRLKRMNRALATEHEMALSGERSKSEFISTVSHELRTPLTSIKGALDMVQSGKIVDLPTALKNLLAIATRNTNLMITVVNDILDIQKISSGTLELEVRATDITALLRASAKNLQYVAAERDVRFTVEDSGACVIIAIDKHRIGQVLQNLLSNAAKFSPVGGEVIVSMQCHAGGVRVAVRDRGCGIPAGDRQRIFRKFTQGDSSDARQVGGTGLGLAIAKEIVELHGGTIGVVPAPGGGSEFFFELPCAVVSYDRKRGGTAAKGEGIAPPSAAPARINARF